MWWGAGLVHTRGASTVATATIGYVRLGMTFERKYAEFTRTIIGAVSVVALLVVLAIGSTLLLTRRLVAPMRRLMRAARAVGSGKLDVYVPASSGDELGLLTHTFNHMTQRLSESQAEVATYQRTLEEKVTQRTKELEVATAQAYKLAQHDILTGLPNRVLLNQRLKQIVAQAGRRRDLLSRVREDGQDARDQPQFVLAFGDIGGERREIERGARSHGLLSSCARTLR